MTISTHTLTWSVTPPLAPNTIGKYDFNSHAHVERDFGDSLFNEVCRISTHTLTWSVTHPGIVSRAKTIDFNSHAHVERDQARLVQKSRRTRISTHTLTWSVTGQSD